MTVSGELAPALSSRIQIAKRKRNPDVSHALEAATQIYKRARLDRYSNIADLTYEHRWTARELLLWDNRCVMHRATPYDPATQGRVIRRCTVLGEVPA